MVVRTIYIVKVHFYSIDMGYEWDKIYRIKKRPSMAWMRKLYDGVNEPQYYRTLNTIKEPKDVLNPSCRR